MKQTVKILVRLAILSIVLLVIYSQLSLNFTFLGIIGLALIGVAIYFVDFKYDNELPYRENGKQFKAIPDPPVKNPNLGLWAAWLLTGFSIITLWTLKNYFYADKNVYTNNEHHALRIDGIRIPDARSFLLANNDSLAFFDDEQFHGSISIASVDENGVTLKCEGFTHPIYKQVRVDEFIRDTSVNTSNIISFTEKDSIIFKAKNGHSIGFGIIERDEDNGKICLTNKRDSAYYYFSGQKSKVTNALSVGYGLNGLLGSIVCNADVNLSGINIVREIARPKAKNRAILETETRYILDINDLAYKQDYNGKNQVSEIIVSGKSYSIDHLNKLSYSIFIPFAGEDKKSSGVYYLGYGDTKTVTFSFQKDTSSKNGLIIKYEMPYYRQLYGKKGRTENSLYVTSSLVEALESESLEGIGINVPNNTALYDIFDHSNNINNFKPFHLAFNASHTTDSLVALHEESGKLYKSGDEIVVGGMYENSGIEWIFTVENLRDTAAPFTSENMLWVVFCVCVASILISCIYRYKYDRYFYHRFTFSYAEFALHITLIFYTAFRCFLLWRISVFLPLESISPYEKEEIFRQVDHFIWFLCSLGGFYAILLFTKLFILNYGKRHNSGWLLDDKILELIDRTFIRICSIEWLSKWWLLVQITCYTVALLAVIKLGNTRVAVVTIVLLYFFCEAVIYAKSRFNTYAIGEIAPDDEDGRVTLLLDFLYSLVNMALAIFCILLIGDTGFVIMIATFCLVAIGFKIQDSYLKLTRNDNKKDFLYAIGVIAYIFIVFLMLLSYKKLILFTVNSPYSILILSVVLIAPVVAIFKYANVKLPNNRFRLINLCVCIVAFLWGTIMTGIAIHVEENLWKLIGLLISSISGVVLCVYAVKKLGSKDRKQKIVIANTLSLGVAFIIGAASIWTFFPDEDSRIITHLGAHTQQRVKVLYGDAQDILAKTQNNLEESRFLQASHNHWIIEEYHKRSENVSLFGDGGTGFFKIHPQSKLGALWNAQVTDIVLIRYVITEHSKILPLILMMFFMAMLIKGIKMTTYYRFTKSILIQVPLLLFVQSLLIWMANTQRFIFFGQDFPLISITSKVMLIYFFILFSLWIIAAVIESVMYLRHNDKDYKALSNYNKKQSRLLSVALLIILFISFITGEPGAKSKDDNSGVYNMSELFVKARPYINAIDSLFTEYQKTHKGKVVLKRDMQPQLYEFNRLYKDRILDTLKKLSKVPHKDQKLLRDSTEYKYVLRIWENFVNGGARNNSYNSLIRVHNNNVISEKDRRLKISVKENYYYMRLPNYTDNEWTGNIVEADTINYGKPAPIDRKDYKLYVLSESWMRAGETPFFIRKKKSTKDLKVYSIENNRYVAIADSGIENVLSLENSDVVKLGKETQKLPIGNHKYWARNVLVNGRNQFIYPQGKDMFWIRDFAAVVRGVKNGELSSSDSKDSLKRDVPITLNKKLTSAIIDVYEKNEKKSPKGVIRNVIVADGDGYIRAMVDYKKGYDINPNNYEKIEKINEDLYMNYSKHSYNEESFWFENWNLRHLHLGPASSQKPLVWNAVASYVNWDWDKLVLKGTDSDVTHYNGKDMKDIRYQSSDERNGADINLENYLAYSSNYYNALMTYMGLHSKEHYDKNNKFLKPVGINDKNTESAFRYVKSIPTVDTAYRKNYPFFKIINKGKKERILRLNHKISKDEYNKSLLYHQFTTFFGLQDTICTGREIGNLYPSLSKNNDNIYWGYSAPAISSLNFRLFPKKDVIESGMRNIAIGGLEFWNVTPLHMAEMYGRMVSMNKAFHLTIEPNSASKPEEWDVQNKNYVKHRSTMFKGMNNFFTNGTGVYKGEKIMSLDSNGGKTVGNKTYYLYGKTGTATGGENVDLNKDDTTDRPPRRLVIIISDTQLHYGNDVEPAPKPGKFYVLYFTYEVTDQNFYKTSNGIIEEVLKSEVFNDYMNKLAKD